MRTHRSPQVVRSCPKPCLVRPIARRPLPRAPAVQQTMPRHPVRDTIDRAAGKAVAPSATPSREPVGGAAWIAATRFVPLASAEVATKLLATVREHVRQGKQPVVIFDLDYTLYDNDPRMVAVMREWAATKDADAFPKVKAALVGLRKDQVRYSAADTVRAAGISAEETDAVMKVLLPFFLSKFLDNPHTAMDPLIAEIAELARKLADAGARVVFLTGRVAPDQGEGTLQALARDGFSPDASKYFLFLKPFAKHPNGTKYTDAEFKRDVRPKLDALGDVVGTLDNEPANVMGFVEGFPGAMNIFVNTKWSDAKVEPGDGLYLYVPRG